MMRHSLVTLLATWDILLVILLSVLAQPSSSTSDTFFSTRSGRKVPLSILRSHVPQVKQSHFRNLVFELDNNHLSSHFASIEVPPSSSAILVEQEPIPFFYNGVQQADDASTALFRETPDGFTFMYDLDASSSFRQHYSNYSYPLLSMWGPSLMLHPIDRIKHPGIFLNAAAYRRPTIPTFSTFSNSAYRNESLTNADRVAQVLHKLQLKSKMDLPNQKLNVNSHVENKSNAIGGEILLGKCNGIFSFEIGVSYDASFCKENGGQARAINRKIRRLIFGISRIFEKSACVRLAPVYVDSYCDETRFDIPSQLQSCKSGNSNSTKHCRRSEIMLERVSRDWQTGVSGRMPRDAGFLFTGYSDGSPVAGATYRAQACNHNLSFAWVEHAIPAVFAHEVGHMLGAEHDSSGVMTPSVDPDDAIGDIFLSNNSRVRIRRFVERDARGWCLRRDDRSFGYLQRTYKWSGSENSNNPILISFAQQNSNVSDATFANIFSDNIFFNSSTSNDSMTAADLMYIISEQKDESEAPNVYYSIIRGVTCNTRGSCFGIPRLQSSSKAKYELPIQFEKGSFGFSFAFGHLKSLTSRDLVVMHIHPCREKKGLCPSYRVVHGLSANGSAPPLGEWQQPQNISGFAGENIQCASISLGLLSTRERREVPVNDIVYVQVDRKKHKNIVEYWVGKDISSTGVARCGWTEAHEIPGWFGEITTSVSAQLIDMDGNGMPELILYHVDDTPTVNSGFIRIGKDMNSTGHITNGWSDFRQVPVLAPGPTGRSGVMAVHPKLGENPYPVVASIQRQQLFFRRWDVNFGASVLTQDLLATSKYKEPLEDYSIGCDECYSLLESRVCKRTLGRCQSTVDEVLLKTEVRNTTSPSISLRDIRGGELQANSIQHNALKNNSIFCEGFNYLYVHHSGCAVVDKATVLGKGLEVLFRKLVNEIDPEVSTNMTTNSLFESPSGPNVNGRPVVAEAEIKSKKQSFRDTLKKAYQQIMRRAGFHSFFKLGQLDGIAEKTKDGYIVRFFFKTKHW